MSCLFYFFFDFRSAVSGYSRGWSLDGQAWNVTQMEPLTNMKRLIDFLNNYPGVKLKKNVTTLG